MSNESKKSKFSFAHILAFLLCLLFIWPNYLIDAREIPSDVKLGDISTIPLQIGPWKGVDTDPLLDTSLDILKLDQYIRRRYQNTETREVVDVYVGYWLKQHGQHQAAKHSPEICLPAAGYDVYAKTRSSISIPLENDPNHELTVKQVHSEFHRSNEIHSYWFFAGDVDYTEEWQALIHVSTQNLITGRSNGGIAKVSVAMVGSQPEDLQKAKETSKRFIKEFYPKLRGITQLEQ